MKDALRDNLESIVVLMLFGIFGLLKIILANKFAFLNLYFIPVLLAGYYLGKKRAILSSIASVLLVLLFMIRWPQELMETQNQLYMGLNLLVWASLLVLASIIVSTLNESRQRRLAVATLKLLEKYLRNAIEGPDNHPARVAALAKAIAKELRLPTNLVETIEAASLLHDIGDSAVQLDMITGWNDITVARQSTVVSSAVPILLGRHRHHRRRAEAPPPIGSRILAVADLFDEAASHNPHAEPWEAIKEIESRGGLDVPVVAALKRALQQPA